MLDDIEQRHWDLGRLKKQGITEARIPVSKVMWLEGGLPERMQTTLSSLNRPVTKQDIQTVEILIENVFGNFKDMSNIEKVVAVDSYLQKEIQYIGFSETCIDGTRYRASDPKIDEFNSSLAPDRKTHGQPLAFHTNLLTALTGSHTERNRGTCNDFAILSTLLLNNPIANVPCYDSWGNGHQYNNIVLDNGIYSLDITQNVCAGQNRFQHIQQNGMLQSSAYNHGATLTTAEDLDIGGSLGRYLEHEIASPNGNVFPKGYSPLNWWESEKIKKDALGKNRKDGSDPMRTDGINDDYMTLTSKYPHAAEPIPREQIEAAVESLKKKGFGHLFEYPKQPYYRQIAEPLKLSEVHKDADPERL